MNSVKLIGEIFLAKILWKIMNFLSAKPAKVILILGFVFLGAQAFTGEQGLLSWRQYSIRADQLEREKAALDTRSLELKEKIAQLKGESSQRDAIEEIAMNQLIMASPDDIAIKIPTTESK